MPDPTDPDDLEDELDELDEEEAQSTKVVSRHAEIAVLKAIPGDTIVLRLHAPCPQKIHAQIDAAFAKRFRHVEGVRTLVLGHDQSIEIVRPVTVKGELTPEQYERMKEAWAAAHPAPVNPSHP